MSKAVDEELSADEVDRDGEDNICCIHVISYPRHKTNETGQQ